MIKVQFLRLSYIKSVLLCLCLWCSLISISYAQWTDDARKELLESKSDIKNLVQPPVNKVPPLEGPVDPEKYFVGPSDILSINIWTSPPLNLSLTVTPEGTLIIPTVGEVRIADITLAEAKRKIIAEIKKKYLSGSPSVTLLNPRQITVTVTGAVRYPGKYELNATDRVDKAIAMANKMRKDEPPEYNEIWELRLYERRQSKRDIRLTKRTGESSRVDVLSYYATKEDQWNPSLREGDEIFVPRIDPKKNIFGIYGSVNMQGNFELIEGDSLLDALDLSYGFTTRAMKDSVVLYRYNINLRKQDLKIIDFNKLQHGSPENIALMPGDRIVVKEQPDIREDYRVIAEGEVIYPGVYPITKDSTKLTSIINWCGGFTEYASLLSAQVYRGTISRQELEIERLLSMRGSMTPEDSAYYLLETELRTKREVVNVDFRKLFIDKDTTQDVYLRNGDYISVPSILRTIYVFGQVVNPGNIPFISGMDYKYYIKKCDGYTDKARTGDVMIIKRATRQWLSPDETKIEEGDYVWVPRKPERSFAYYMNILGQTASVLSVAVSIILLVIQSRK